ncbi:MAG: GSU2403 family nucleotidyltransferase fold protein [Hyphomicrobium sp.]
MASFSDLSLDQRRQLIDAQQLFSAYRTERARLVRAFAGHMRWKSAGGHEYLTHVVTGSEKSLGKRSAETEVAFETFTRGREDARVRKTRMLARLESMDRLNKAHRLARVPDLTARIVDSLDRAGLMGAGVRIVGTTALYAYEAMAGVRFDTAITATQDFDLMMETEQELSLAGDTGLRSQVFAALLEADRSFVARYGEMAVNGEGFIVNFLAPDGDTPAPVTGPQAAEIAIGESGRPIFMAVPTPRAFATHKRWLSQESSRKAMKRARDAAQAEAVEAILPLLPGG